MAMNCRFAFAVHVLSVLALHREENLTSEMLASSVNTNAVVIRRLLSELSGAGLVETQRGPGGGARLSQSPQEISLLHIHRAVAGETEMFGAHPQAPEGSCPVGKEIERVLAGVSQRARRVVEAEYAAISLSDVLTQMRVAKRKR